MSISIENVIRKKLTLASGGGCDNPVNIVSALNENTNDVLLEEIDYNSVSHLYGYEMPYNLTLVCDMSGVQDYEHLEFIEVTRKSQTIEIQAEVNFRLSQWDLPVNVLSFIEALRERVVMECGVSSDLEALYDEDLLHIKFHVEDYIGSRIVSVVDSFTSMILELHQAVMVDLMGPSLPGYARISREIRLPKESVHTSVSLLHFLTLILSRRFGNDFLSVSIEQKKESVTINIDTVAKGKQAVLKVISDYAEVLSGKLDAEDFFAAPVSLATFNHKLETLKEEIIFSYKDSFEVVTRPVDSVHIVDKDLINLKQAISKGLLETSAPTIENNSGYLDTDLQKCSPLMY